MKASELKDLTLDELRNLRFQLATSQLENPMRLPLTRKDLARVKTVITEKEQAAERTE